MDKRKGWKGHRVDLAPGVSFFIIRDWMSETFGPIRENWRCGLWIQPTGGTTLFIDFRQKSMLEWFLIAKKEWCES